MHRPKLFIKLGRRPSNHNSRLLATTPQAVAYLRIRPAGSTEPGRVVERSLAEQREAINRTAAKLGAVVIEEFTDIKESAGNMNRPALRHMLQLVKEEPVTYCIVHRLDRLTRHLPDAMRIESALTHSGVTLLEAATDSDDADDRAPLDATSESTRTPNREE